MKIGSLIFSCLGTVVKRVGEGVSQLYALVQRISSFWSRRPADAKTSDVSLKGRVTPYTQEESKLNVVTARLLGTNPLVETPVAQIAGIDEQKEGVLFVSSDDRSEKVPSPVGSADASAAQVEEINGEEDATTQLVARALFPVEGGRSEVVGSPQGTKPINGLSSRFQARREQLDCIRGSSSVRRRRF